MFFVLEVLATSSRSWMFIKPPLHFCTFCFVSGTLPFAFVKLSYLMQCLLELTSFKNSYYFLLVFIVLLVKVLVVHPTNFLLLFVHNIAECDMTFTNVYIVWSQECLLSTWKSMGRINVHPTFFFMQGTAWRKKECFPSSQLSILKCLF